MQIFELYSATYAYLDSVYGIFLITLDHTNRV